MKFLARRSDGMVLSRFENSRLVFPIPSDTIIYDSPADISEAEMPNGTNLGGFVAAKIAAFQRLHPTYSGSHTYNGEFVSPDCDLSESLPITYGTIASGPGKTTILRPGAVLVTNPIASGSPNVTLCVRYNAFVMGSSHSHPTLRYYNYDENLGNFSPPPLANVSVHLLDALTVTPIMGPIQSDFEDATDFTPLPDFRVAFVNAWTSPVYISDWTIITKDFLPA
jgi:hypothetical protein